MDSSISMPKMGASQNIFGMEFLPREGLHFLFHISHPNTPSDGAQNKGMHGRCKEIRRSGRDGLLSLNTLINDAIINFLCGFDMEKMDLNETLLLKIR